jgi:hypothetical protein
LFTYLQQARHLRILKGSGPSYPAAISVSCLFAPPQLFGVGEGPIRASRLGSSLALEWDANADRTYCRASPGFSALTLTAESMGGTFTVVGNRITFNEAVNSADELHAIIGILLFALPASLSTTLPDPVFVERIEGLLGEAEFRIEHLESVTPLIVLSDAILAERVSAGLSALSQLAPRDNARLLAATGYVYRAARLFAAGCSPWEFMAEGLLNYSKALEVLFGDTRDEQRLGLRAVGIDDNDIETRFIPVTLLRDSLDVAHPRLAQIDGGRLRGVYLFLVGLEGDFQRLLAAVRQAVVDGGYALRSPGRLAPETIDLHTIDRIVAADAARREAMARARATDA